MQSEPNWEDTGLEPELMFKPNSMPFWLQYPQRLLVQVMVHEIREHIMKVEFQMGFIRSQPHSIIDYSGRKTPVEVCEAIQRYQDELKDIMNVLWEYAQAKMADQQE